MKRIIAVCASLVLLVAWAAACGGGPTPDQVAVKQAYIRQLVGFCAEVVRHMTKIDVKAQPGLAADEFERFVGQARNRPAPDVDRPQLENMLVEIDGVVGQYRSAQSALSVGDRAASQEALTLADRQLQSADSAAQKYGMPPLGSCPEHESPGPTAAPPSEAAGWKLRHEALVAVQQVGAAVLDGRVWVAGGLTDAHEATAATQFYDPTIDSWEMGPPLPEPVHHALLVTYRNQLTVIGGFLPRGGDLLAVTSPRVFILDSGAGRWVEGPPLHYPRAAGAAAVVGDKIVVVGGRIGSPEELVGQTEVFDGNGWHDGAAIPVPGDHLAAAGDQNYLYAVGGRKFTAGSNTTAVQRYDPATDQWVMLPSVPEPLSGAGAAIVDGQLITAGGEGVTTVSAAVQAFDLDSPTGTWTALPPLNQGRHGLGVAAIGNTLYAIGGSTRAGHTASTNIIGALTVPPPRTHAAAGWKLRHEALVAVQQVGAAVLDGRVWVAGGLTDAHEATAATQFYDPTIDSWEMGPPLPEPVHHALLVTYRNQLTVIGGFLPRGGDLLAVTSPRVFILDSGAGRWVEGPPLHYPRAAGAAAVVGDKIVVVGGRIGSPEELVGQTEVFDGNGWHDGAAIPVPGDHLAAAGDQNYLYAVGGRKFTAGSNTTAVQRYDPATDQWVMLPSVPEPLSGAGAAIVDGQLITAGGEGVTTVSAAVQAFDLDSPTGTWTALPPLNQGRHGLGVAAIGNTLYAIGGSTRAGHTASTNIIGALTFS